MLVGVCGTYNDGHVGEEGRRDGEGRRDII